jgi:hypothetical protein
MHQLGDAASRFDCIHHPLPVAAHVDRHRRVWLAAALKLLEGAAFAGDAGFGRPVACCLFDVCEGVMRMGVKRHVWPLAAPPLEPCSGCCLTPSIPRDAKRGGAFIISLQYPWLGSKLSALSGIKKLLQGVIA